MGAFRFILAACVLATHSGDASGWLLDGTMAVAVFFIVSGFYMAMVLDTRYGRDYRMFIINRLLRILPTYYLLLAFAVVLYCGASLWVGHPVDRLVHWNTLWKNAEWGEIGFLSLVQLTVVGVDWPCLLQYDAEQGLTPNFIESSGAVLAERFLFLPHAWSIGVELAFYFIAPLLVRLRTPFLAAIGLASGSLNIAIRVLLYDGMRGRWAYENLPTQLVFFIAGILVFRHRQFFLTRVKGAATWVLSGVLLTATLTFGTVDERFAEPAYLLLATVMIPTLFAATKESKLDVMIGNLSYPMYMVHIPVRWLLLGPKASHGDIVSGPLLLFWTVVASLVIYHVLEQPIDRWRHSRFPARGSPKPVGEQAR